jgi:hypothetical protein
VPPGRPQSADESAPLPGEPGSPFETGGDALEFLREAEVIAVERIPTGVTEPQKVLLQGDGVRAYAVFRYVDLVKEQVWMRDGTFHRELRDSALFEVAAYRLSVRLGLDNVPPTVVRTIGNRQGSLQLWVDNAMTEADRRRQNIRPADLAGWLAQKRIMTLFDAVVGNIDRHAENYLLDDSGKLWMIDHTRAFQKYIDEWTPEPIALCERSVWRRLQGLDRHGLDELLGDLLTTFEIDHLAERIDAVVAHIRAQIDARGENAVIVGTASA